MASAGVAARTHPVIGCVGFFISTYSLQFVETQEKRRSLS
jgi:hypothetical protein